MRQIHMVRGNLAIDCAVFVKVIEDGHQGAIFGVQVGAELSSYDSSQRVLPAPVILRFARQG